MSSENNTPAEVPEVVVRTITCEYGGHEVPESGRLYHAESGERNICDNCLDRDFGACISCEGFYHHDSRVWQRGEEGYCAPCYQERQEELEDEYDFSVPYRPYSSENLPAFQSSERGTIITSSRLFSAEIECISPSTSALHDASVSLSQAFGVSEDGSLPMRGVEFQTPKLKGKKGEQAIRQICSVLNDREFSISRECGLHIHLDGQGLIPKTLTKEVPHALRDLMLFHVRYEKIMHTFLPPSRRANRYCIALSRNTLLNEDAIASAKTLRDLEKLWYATSSVSYIDERKDEKYDGTRYYGINFHSLIGSKHLEVRYHSGTLNAGKILHWTALHQRIMDMAVMGGFVSIRNKPVTLEAFFSLLSLPEKTEAYLRARAEKFAPKVEAPAEYEEDMICDNESAPCAV